MSQTSYPSLRNLNQKVRLFGFEPATITMLVGILIFLFVLNVLILAAIFFAGVIYTSKLLTQKQKDGSQDDLISTLFPAHSIYNMEDKEGLLQYLLKK